MVPFARSLKELKDGSVGNPDMRETWVPLEPFFASKGLALWVTPPDTHPGSDLVAPPDERIRAPDAFSYRSPGDMDRSYEFCLTSPFLCPARTVDGRDVMIRVVSIGDDGLHHRKALERLATGNVASVIGNHTIPVLQWLEQDGIIFAVFPFVSFADPTTAYIFEDARDLLSHLHQMIEAVEFCHSRLVAHRDLFEGNFLSNFYGAADVDVTYNRPPRGRRIRPLRSLFPFMVYLIDFERAVCFELDSDPSSRLVKGRPVPYTDPNDPSSSWQYNHPAAPEMDMDQPHNPFLADVWQLGTYFSQLEENYTLPPGVIKLVRQMTAESPAERPTAKEALATMRQLLYQLSLDELCTQVWNPPTTPGESCLSMLVMTLSGFPRSLKELKNTELVNYDLRTNWDPLEPFFLSQGYKLWVFPVDYWPGSGVLAPPDDRIRAPDGFIYRSPDDMDRRYDFCVSSPFICPARTTDGRDVVIRVVSIAEDGMSHRRALERLATGNTASAIGNHTVPVLQWLRLDDIVFAVHPYLSAHDAMVYAFEDTRDLLAQLYQMVEAVEFCHSRLVAHRDLCQGNFLCNFYGAGNVHSLFRPPSPGERVKPLRSLFPFKVYLIDFERAICFDAVSDPSTRTVTGRPLLYDDPTNPSTYTNPAAPEMDRPEPHDPFRADIWQLGTYFSELSENYTLPRPLVHLIERMTAVSPLERPTATEALEAIRQMMSQLSLDELCASAWKPTVPADAPDVPHEV